MPLTQEQREARRRFLGASDSPAVVGVDPYRTAADVYAEKVYGTVDETSEAMEIGNVAEPGLLSWAAQKIGVELDTPGSFRVGVLGCNPDGVVRGENGSPVAVIQAKTAGIMWSGGTEDWGDDGTDEVPDRVIVQVHHEMFVTGARLAWVPALVGGLGLRLYRIEYKPKLAESIAEIGRRFMLEHVEKRVPPTGEFASLDTLRRVIREPGKAADVDPEIVERFIAARDVAKAAKETEDLARAELLSALGDAEIGRAGAWTVDYRASVRRAYSVAETQTRRLLVKATKEALHVG